MVDAPSFSDRFYDKLLEILVKSHAAGTTQGVVRRILWSNLGFAPASIATYLSFMAYMNVRCVCSSFVVQWAVQYRFVLGFVFFP